MNPIQSVKTCYKKYAVFKGVASRSEYWWFATYASIIQLGIMLFLASNPEREGMVWTIGLFGTLALFLSTVIPLIAVGCRRLHDIGISGWWQLCCLIPMVGPLTFFLMVIKSRPSKYNPDSPSFPV